jgi:hypothetical protein
MRVPCVYGWRRGNRWLYVGASRVGCARFLGDHHVIGKRAPLRPGDEIVVWPVRGPAARARLEWQLVQELQPLYNRDKLPHRPAPFRPRRCRYPRCQAPFRARRSDQFYHSEACRNAHWRELHPRKVVHADAVVHAVPA